MLFLVNGHQFIFDWLKEAFDLSCVRVEWETPHKAIIDDGRETMTVELKDHCLYADDRVVSSIPSLVDIV